MESREVQEGMVQEQARVWGFCKEYNIGVDSPGMDCYKAAIAARPLIWRARYSMGSSSHTTKA